LTGLAEYRNGGLFIDCGALAPREDDLLRRPLDPFEEPVVEWRALTVALLDRLAPRVRDRLGLNAAEFPLAKVLEGGSWTAGREIAAEIFDPMAARRWRSPATEPCFEESRAMPQPALSPSRPRSVTIVDHPLVRHKLSLMRAEDTSTSKFRQLMREISLPLGYEATRDLALEETLIETPARIHARPLLAGKKLCLVSILRAGNGILDGMLDLVPAARVGHIGILSRAGHLAGDRILPEAAGRPARARRHSIGSDARDRQLRVAAISRLVELRARSIKFVCLVAALKASRSCTASFPGWRSWPRRSTAVSTTTAISCRPRDAGDRLFGTK